MNEQLKLEVLIHSVIRYSVSLIYNVVIVWVHNSAREGDSALSTSQCHPEQNFAFTLCFRVSAVNNDSVNSGSHHTDDSVVVVFLILPLSTLFFCLMNIHEMFVRVKPWHKKLSIRINDF